MKKLKVLVGKKEYICDIAETAEEQRKGLQGRSFLAPNEGMLFKYNSEGTREFWMKDTEIPLDQIGINDDDEVTQVFSAVPNNETLVTFKNCKYLLEVNADSGIQVGDSFAIDDEDFKDYTMKVLAPDGSTQFFLKGGERIFSRVSTLKMVRLAKEASKVKDSDPKAYKELCIKLGRTMLRELHAQDNRDPEYVKVPD